MGCQTVSQVVRRLFGSEAEWRTIAYSAGYPVSDQVTRQLVRYAAWEVIFLGARDESRSDSRAQRKRPLIGRVCSDGALAAETGPDVSSLFATHRVEGMSSLPRLSQASRDVARPREYVCKYQRRSCWPDKLEDDGVPLLCAHRTYEYILLTSG